MNIQIANRLKKLRKENGYSQEQLAEKLGISRQAIYKWEIAESSPDADNLICLAKLYGVTIDYLLTVDNSNSEVKFINKTNEKQNTINKPNDSLFIKIGSNLVILISLILYFILGGIWNLWHPGWIVFLIIPIVTSLLEVIEKKNFSIFCYPVLVTLIYLILGFIWSLWHPWWILFITIPVYYIICNLFKRK